MRYTLVAITVPIYGLKACEWGMRPRLHSNEVWRNTSLLYQLGVPTNCG